MLWLTAAMLLGCFGCVKTPQRFERTWYDVFDTVTVLTGYADSAEEFDAVAERAHQKLLEYHYLFDIYHDAPGGANLKTVNDCAGEAVSVDPRITELLVFCREADAATHHRVDVTLGAVLRLWHDAREAALADPDHAAVPDAAALREAKRHTGFALLEIDEAAHTVRLTDPLARLDVGAIAKGYAGERVAQGLPDGYLLNLGHNVVANGAKPGGAAWTVGIQNPRSSGLLCTIPVTDQAVVTSGDYQRTFTVNGKDYHHIIDPDTLAPAEGFASVTVRCASSAAADMLSTALFLLPQAEGERLLGQYSAEALWVAPDGTVTKSDGWDA